jgi:heme-degrading monooxygenase HmoA
MQARVTTVTVQPRKLDEAISVARDSIMPAAKKQKGFKQYLLLVDRNAGKGITITLWNTEADMTASEGGGFYREQLAKAAPLFAGSPGLDHYEVSVRS